MTAGMPARNGRGLYAAELIEQFPHLPVEEEGRLNDIKLRENFIVRVFAYHRLRNLFKDSYKRGDLVKFHTVHKYLLLSHSPEYYKQLGKLVADVKKHTQAENMWIQVRRLKDRLEVSVRDDGQGFDVDQTLPQAETRGSLGMIHMHESAELLQGSLTLQSAIDEGTIVCLAFPLEPNM